MRFSAIKSSYLDRSAAGILPARRSVSTPWDAATHTAAPDLHASAMPCSVSWNFNGLGRRGAAVPGKNCPNPAILAGKTCRTRQRLPNPLTQPVMARFMRAIHVFLYFNQVQKGKTRGWPGRAGP
jgi:hypothetical protein